MTEPIYEEDSVNLGYLNKRLGEVSEDINIPDNISRHYASKPQPPYYKGDTWIDGDIVYTCIKSREIGTYNESDWVTESGAKKEAGRKNKTYLTQPSNYNAGDMWILQSDDDHKAGKKGEMLISTAGRREYDEGDWVNMLGYGTIRSINEVSENLNKAINRIGYVEEAIGDGIITTFYQNSEPEGKHIGDLWYVTGEIEGYITGKIYRYDGTVWNILDDPEIQKAFDEANEARIVADGKIQSFYSDTEPTKGVGVGDLWIDLANNNQLYRYNGTKWVAVYDTRINELVVNVESVTERVATIETDLGEIDLKVEETTTKITTIEGNVNNITNTTFTAEGKSIYITDSAEEPLVDISLHGETEQQGKPTPDIPIPIENVEGKNKFNYTKASDVSNTFVSTYRLFEITDLKPNTQYTISGYDITGPTTAYIYMWSGDTMATATPRYWFSGPDGYDTKTTKTFTSNANGSIYLAMYQSTEDIWNEFIQRFANAQIEEGTVATEYVPYNSLEVKVTRKNYLKVTDTDNLTFCGASASVKNGVINVNGATTTSGNAYFDSFKIPTNGDYTLSLRIEGYTTKASQNASMLLQVSDDNVNFSTAKELSFGNTTLRNTVVTLDNTKYYRLRIYLYSECVFTNATIKVQIEKGTQLTDFEPYQEQTAYFPLAEGQKLYEGSYLAEDGVHDKKKQVTIPSTIVGAYNPEEDWFYIGKSNFENINITSGTLLSNYFTEYSFTDFKGSLKPEGICCGWNTHILFRIKGYTTTEEYKEFFANNIVLEYELAEEEIISYTEEQQGAWNKIKALTTYKNITNITSDAYAKIVYMRDNGLDVYETKQNATKSYTETNNKLAEQKITVDGIVSEVSDITSKTNTLTGEIEEVNAKISEVNQSIEGLGIKVQNKGGNNLFYYDTEFWDSADAFNLEEFTDTEIKGNSVGGIGYIVNKGSAYQSVEVQNGTYVVSFKYKKIGTELASASVKINGEEYPLTTTDWEEFVQTINVNANHITVEFISDTDNTLYVADLLGNLGTEKDVWTQNPNETRTDTVKIGKGIQVDSSETNTYHRIDSDGNRTYNRATGKVVNEAADKGTVTEELVVRGQAQISGMLVQQIGNQTWISSLL